MSYFTHLRPLQTFPALAIASSNPSSRQRFPRVDGVKGQKSVKGHVGGGLPDLDEKHLELHHGPAEAVDKGFPGHALEAVDDDGFQNLAAVGELALLGPHANRALERGLGDSFEAELAEVVGHVGDGVEVGAEGEEALGEVQEEISEAVGGLGGEGGVVGLGFVVQLLDF